MKSSKAYRDFANPTLLLRGFAKPLKTLGTSQKNFRVRLCKVPSMVFCKAPSISVGKRPNCVFACMCAHSPLDERHKTKFPAVIGWNLIKLAHQVFVRDFVKAHLDRGF